MSDKFMRHFIAFVGAIISLIIFWAGFMAAQNGWWWSGFGVIVIYITIYMLIEV